ncbi:hypothetical protein F8388_000412 [Cannabis sativa]|uniref:Uncharacterized protein n=1 Tax=Cannabis sativa TaxID=3483 RepID=A0A7J6HFC5_CANSA|nr:hypothetical protein F8388_000412 [Cannabis sativa]KAF4394006.1 hypothetical protein G4B88_025975 [Cannabis sativa]
MQFLIIAMLSLCFFFFEISLSLDAILYASSLFSVTGTDLISLQIYRVCV